MEDRTLTATADILAESPDRITVLCDYRSKESVRAVPGARWSTTTRHWTVPLSWTACLALRAEFGKALIIGDDLRTWAKTAAEAKAMLRELRPKMEVETPIEMPSWWETLFPHQQVDALAIANAKRYLLLNSTGTGKTRGALAGLALLDKPLPALITAPLSMLHTWEREIPLFFPEATISVVEGTPKKVREALEPGWDFYIVGWESLRKYSRLEGYGSTALTAEEKQEHELNTLGFKAFIGDELHRCQSPTAKRTRAAWYLAHNCEYRIGLTGTPIQDTIENLYGLLHLVEPDEYPTKTGYLDRFAIQTWNVWGGRDITGIREDRADEFYNNFNAISRRVTKEMALPFLPPKVEEVRWVTLSPKARKAYNAMRDTYIAELADGSIMASENQLVRAGRLVQLANMEMEAGEEEGEFVSAGVSDKVSQFMDDFNEGDFDGHQIVVFSDSLGVLDILQEKLVKAKVDFVRIDGSVTGPERQAAMDAFQEGRARLCLLTRAGGEGITLTAASVMVRLVRSWSYTVHQQVEDRVHRIGSEIHESVLYVDYVTIDTIEEKVLVRLNAKDARATEALTAGELLAMLRSDGAYAPPDEPTH